MLRARASAIRRGIAAAMGCVALLSGAATLDVSPLVHDVPAGQRTLALSITNRGDAAVTVQVRVFRWSQDDGRELLTDAQDVAVSPVIFALAPGRLQHVRALLPQEPADRERSYRILIDEIPDVSGREPVRLALRLSLPVFRAAAAAGPAALSWHIDATTRRLVAHNGGQRRERLRQLTLRSPDGDTVQPTSPWGLYLLAGRERSWSIAATSRAPAPGERWTLSAETDAGRLELPVTVAP